MISYALLFISAVFGLTAVVITMDILESKLTRKALDNAIKENRGLIYVHVFKVLAEIAVLWLIVSFFGQILMGWISI